MSGRGTPDDDDDNSYRSIDALPRANRSER
jgi:hypothetical protein